MPDKSFISNLQIPLRQQMLLAFSLVLAVMTALLASFVDSQLVRSSLQARGQQNSQDAAFFANLLDSDIRQHFTDIRVRADYITALDFDRNLPGLQRAMNLLQSAQPQYAWIGFVTPEGRVVASTRNLLMGADVSQRNWFQRASKEPVVLDVHEAKLLASLLPRVDPTQPLRFVDVAAPAFSEQGRLLGVMGAHLSVDWLSAKVKTYASSRLKGYLARPAILGSDGELRFGDASSVRGLAPGQLRQLTAAGDRGWVELTPSGGEPTLYGYARHRGFSVANDVSWITVIPMRRSDVLDELRATRLTALGGVMLMSTLAWLTFYFLLHLASRPVRQLMLQVRQAQQTHTPLDQLEGLPREFGEIQGALNGFLASLRQREQQLEQALHELRDSFTGVSETFPGVLFRMEAAPDGQALFTYLSPSAARYLRLEPGRVPLPVLELLNHSGEGSPALAARQLAEQVSAAQPLDLSFQVAGDDGIVRCMRLSGQLRASAQGRRIWHGVIIDISDLMAARQAAADADAAKSRFLATMSHEIRMPLNGILGFAQLLQQELQDASHRADARKIIDTAETLTRILNDILDFSKIEEGKLLLESRPFNLVELVESCAALYRLEAGKRGLDFVVQMHGASPARALGDPTRLQQVLGNLLSNAIKFTPQGRICLGVDIEPQGSTAALLRLTVHDTGVGMDAAQQARLFQRFEQLDASVYRQHGGSGLGLAIVRGIVGAMGGDISVESAPGRGTRFLVHLPLRMEHLAPGQPAAEDSPEPLPPLNVLVVDDVAMNRELLVRMLQAQGHRTEQAADGQQALERASAQTFDLILMDIDMPVLDGLAAARQIRSRPGPCQRTPLIALTGYAFESDVALARASGFDEHLAKPVILAKLLAKMRQVLQARAQNA